MTLYTLRLSCGHDVPDAPLPMRPRLDWRSYCQECRAWTGLTEVIDVPEPMPEYAVNILDHCHNCGAPWSHHANLGTGDAAEPVCLCKHGVEFDECRGSSCKGAL